MGAWRRLVLGSVVGAAAVLVPVVSPASAWGGGSSLRTDRDHYRPGEGVHATGTVFQMGDTHLRGPFTAYLVSAEATAPVPVGGVPVGPVQYRESKRPGLAPTLEVNVWFTLPSVPDGSYVVHAQNARGEGLGDMTGTVVYVGSAAPPPPPAPPTEEDVARLIAILDASTSTTTAAPAPTTAAPPPTVAPVPPPAAATAGTDDGPAALVLGALVLVAIAAAGLLLRSRSRRTGRAIAPPAAQSRGQFEGEAGQDADADEEVPA